VNVLYLLYQELMALKAKVFPNEPLFAASIDKVYITLFILGFSDCY
jgi:hypothetical protein